MKKIIALMVVFTLSTSTVIPAYAAPDSIDTPEMNLLESVIAISGMNMQTDSDRAAAQDEAQKAMAAYLASSERKPELAQARLREAAAVLGVSTSEFEASLATQQADMDAAIQKLANSGKTVGPKEVASAAAAVFQQELTHLRLRSGAQFASRSSACTALKVGSAVFATTMILSYAVGFGNAIGIIGPQMKDSYACDGNDCMGAWDQAKKDQDAMDKFNTVTASVFIPSLVGFFMFFWGYKQQQCG